MTQNTQNTLEVNLDSFNIYLEGNIIDHSWYQIFKKSGKIQTNAIILLSDIVYWYRPTAIRDLDTGEVSYKKKFHADILQRSYPQIEEMLGLTKDQARLALEFLESFGIIEREFRIILINGVKVPNIMFLKFFPEKLKEIMSEFKKRITSSEKTDDPLVKNRQPMGKKPTYTETTTKTSSEISLKDNVAKQENVSCSERIEDIAKSKSKFPLKKDQLPIFDKMKALDLGCEDETIKIIIREQAKLNKLDFLNDCIHHMRLKIESGFEFKKEKIAFFRNCLVGKQFLVNEICLKNKASAERFCKSTGWNGLKITEKYVAILDNTGNTLKEISTNISEKEFQTMVIEMKKMSENYE